MDSTAKSISSSGQSKVIRGGMLDVQNFADCSISKPWKFRKRQEQLCFLQQQPKAVLGTVRLGPRILDTLRLEMAANGFAGRSWSKPPRGGFVGVSPQPVILLSRTVPPRFAVMPPCENGRNQTQPYGQIADEVG